MTTCLNFAWHFFLLWIHRHFSFTLEAESSLWISEHRSNPMLLMLGVVLSMTIWEIILGIPAGLPAAFQAHQDTAMHGPAFPRLLLALAIRTLPCVIG